MLTSAFSLPLRILAALLSTGTLATACAQTAPAAPAPPADPRAASPQPATPDPNADFLAKASQLYYSSAKAGLRGFDCRIHPDWRTTILSEQTHQTVTAASPEVLLLKSVTIMLHGRLTSPSHTRSQCRFPGQSQPTLLLLCQSRPPRLRLPDPSGLAHNHSQ